MTDCPSCRQPVDGESCLRCPPPRREPAPRNPETVRRIQEMMAKCGWPKPERVPTVMREPGEDDEDVPRGAVG